MKTQSNVLYVLRITVVLLSIAIVVAAALAVVNSLTAPVIALSNEEKTQQAIAQVLPGGYDTELTEFSSESGLVSRVYRGTNGYAVEVTPAGFDNTITMMVGVGFDGKVLGISIVSHTETAGLGAVAAGNGEKSEAFREQFVGQSGSVSVRKDGGEIDAITGATITSRAVCEGVNAALSCVAALEGGNA